MILVTGGSGFLGAHLLAQLAALDKKVVAVKRDSTKLDYVKKVFELCGAAENFGKVEWKNVDLFDVYDIEAALVGIDEIYHCASEVSFDPKHHQRIVENNITITANLANAALDANIKKFMHVSSTSALGRSVQEEVIDESRIWKTDPVNSKYGFSKYKSEMEVWRAFEEGLPVIVVNPSIILGYCDWSEGSGKMFDRAYTGMKFYTEGYTGWVDVKDVAACMIQLMTKEINGERFIISAENRGFKWVFDEMADSMNKPKAKNAANLGFAKWMVTLEKWKSKLTGKSPLVTTESLRNATLKCSYVNDKVKKELDFKFRPLDLTIKETSELFLGDKK